MSLCCGSEDEEEQQRNNPEEPRPRGCTDVFWLCLFVLFWILLIVIASFSYVYGRPIKLINGYDSFGNICGMKNEKIGTMELSGQDNTQKPYLFFMDIKHLKKSLKICVKLCPNRTLNNIDDVCNFYRQTGSQLCHDKPNLAFSACEYRSSPKNVFGSCDKLQYPIHKSKPILNRCIPEGLTEATHGIVTNLYSWLESWDSVEQVLSDLYKTWKPIVGLCLAAFVLSLIVISIFHVLASVVTWIMMGLVIIACSVGTGLLWMTYLDLKKKGPADGAQLMDEWSLRNESAIYVYAIIATIITIVLLLLLFFIRKKISFMADLFHESAKCLSELPGLFFVPAGTFVVLILYYAFWVSVIVCLATATYPDNSTRSGLDSFDPGVTVSPADTNSILVKNSTLRAEDHKEFTIIKYIPLKWIRYMWWIYFIALIWMSEFITSCETMIISGSVAHWYFRGKNASASPVCSSIGTLFAYHLGSVACGSLLITIFKLPRIILTYLHLKFQKARETSPCADCGFKCCICCFWCLEKFIRYMNHNAYTVIAIEGTNFCNAARIAFTTIISNAVQVAVINGIGDFILFLGKCVVTAATGSIGLVLFRKDPELHFYAAPVLVTCFFAYFIANCVISLYETIIDTLFLCICEDKNLNGENGKWRSSSLAKFNESSNTNGQHELAPMNN